MAQADNNGLQIAIEKALKLEREAKGIIDAPVEDVLYIAHFTINRKITTIKNKDLAAFIIHVKAMQSAFPLLPLSLFTFTNVKAPK